MPFINLPAATDFATPIVEIESAPLFSTHTKSIDHGPNRVSTKQISLETHEEIDIRK